MHYHIRAHAASGNVCVGVCVCVCVCMTGPISQRKINIAGACLQCVFVPLNCVKQRAIIWIERSLAWRYSDWVIHNVVARFRRISSVSNICIMKVC